MLPIPAALLIGWLLMQERPVPPQERPIAGELEGSTSIDAELRTALGAFKSAKGYRFTVEGHCSKPSIPVLHSDEQKPVAPPESPRGANVASAKERPEAAELVQLDGSVERGKPVQLRNEQLEAFRTSEKIAYKMKGQDRWTVASRTPPPVPGTEVKVPVKRDDGTQGEGRRATPQGEQGSSRADTSHLWMSVARIPTPGELLDAVESQVTSCTRSTGDAKAGDSVFECQLRPEAMRWMVEASRRDDAADAIGSWTLRITLHEGMVDQFVLESRAQFKTPEAPPSPPKEVPENPPAATPPSIFLSPPAGPIEVVYRAKVTEIGEIVVKVPEDVAKLLDR